MDRGAHGSDILHPMPWFWIYESTRRKPRISWLTKEANNSTLGELELLSISLKVHQWPQMHIDLREPLGPTPAFVTRACIVKLVSNVKAS